MPTTHLDEDIDLPLDGPSKPRRPTQGPDTARVVFAILVVLLLTVLLAGALGFSMQDAAS